MSASHPSNACRPGRGRHTVTQTRSFDVDAYAATSNVNRSHQNDQRARALPPPFEPSALPHGLEAASLVGGQRIWLDANGVVLQIDPRAVALCDAAFTQAHGILRPRNGASVPAFCRLLADLQSQDHPRDQAVLALPHPAGGMLVVQAYRLSGRARRVFAPAAFMLTIVDPVQPVRMHIAPLQALFGLTAAEARVAAMVGSGDHVQAVARTLDVTTQTIRTHLARIFAKTNTKRQAELVAFLHRLFAWLDVHYESAFHIYDQTS